MAESNRGIVFTNRENFIAHNKGKKLSPETRQRMSESRIGHFVSDETRKKLSESNKVNKLIPIIQYSVEGDLLKIWPSLISIERELGYQVSPGLKLDRIRCGFYWKYYSDDYKSKVDVPVYTPPPVEKGKAVTIDNGIEKLNFRNMTLASVYLNRDTKTVSYAYRHKTKTNGYLVYNQIN